MSASAAPRRPGGRGLATVFALATVLFGLGLLGVAIHDDLAADAVIIQPGWATLVSGVLGAVYTFLGVRALVRLLGGRWGEDPPRMPTGREVRRLRLVALLNALAGLFLLVVGLAEGAGDAIRLARWAPTTAIVAGAFLVLVGLGLLFTASRARRQRDLPAGVTGTSWRQGG
jgi:hypothetical protein